MKKIIIISLIVGCVLFILAKSGVLNSLLLLFLIGAVPGTSYTAPPEVMLLFITAIMWLIVFRFTVIEFVQTRLPLKKHKKSVVQKDHMPRRRYSQI